MTTRQQYVTEEQKKQALPLLSEMAKQPKCETLQQFLEAQRSILFAALEQGYSQKDLVDTLKKCGINISAVTLRKYLKLDPATDPTTPTAPATALEQSTHQDFDVISEQDFSEQDFDDAAAHFAKRASQTLPHRSQAMLPLPSSGASKQQARAMSDHATTPLPKVYLPTAKKLRDQPLSDSAADQDLTK